MCLSVLVTGQLEDSIFTDRAYVVLQKQDLGEGETRRETVGIRERPVVSAGHGIHPWCRQ